MSVSLDLVAGQAEDQKAALKAKGEKIKSKLTGN